MNKLLKFGLPSVLGLLLASPAMAQSGGYNNQMGPNGSQYNSQYEGQHGWNGSRANENYSQNGNNGWNNQRAGQYGWNNPNSGPNGDNQSYGQNGPNGWNNGYNGQYGQNGSYGENGNEPAVTQGFVAHLQRRLQQQGFYRQGNIDGVWGPNTQTALRNFQEQHNLRPTGQIDMRTLEALNLLNGQNEQFGENGNYQTHNHGSQGQNYSSNNGYNGNYGSNMNNNGSNH